MSDAASLLLHPGEGWGPFMGDARSIALGPRANVSPESPREQSNKPRPTPRSSEMAEATALEIRASMPRRNQENSAMAPRIGYLLPTREQVMEDRPEAAPLLALAERAEGLGFDSIWVGDSLLARPRHDPLTLLAAVAARTRRAELRTAVLPPASRHPV